MGKNMKMGEINRMKTSKYYDEVCFKRFMSESPVVTGKLIP